MNEIKQIRKITEALRQPDKQDLLFSSITKFDYKGQIYNNNVKIQ